MDLASCVSLRGRELTAPVRATADRWMIDGIARDVHGNTQAATIVAGVPVEVGPDGHETTVVVRRADGLDSPAGAAVGNGYGRTPERLCDEPAVVIPPGFAGPASPRATSVNPECVCVGRRETIESAAVECCPTR